MMIRLKVFTIVISLLFSIGVIGLVRNRKLREEHSWLWLLTAAGMVMLALSPKLLDMVSTIVGIDTLVSSLCLFALIFFLLLCLQQSLYISDLTNKVKNLSQELALFKAEKNEKEEKPGEELKS